EGGPIRAVEPSACEDIEAGPLALPDVPFRRSADLRSDDSRSEEIVAILERDREGPRVRLERGSILRGGPGGDRRRGGRSHVEAGGARPAPPAAGAHRGVPPAPDSRGI